MDKLKILPAIIVEGKYDKIKLSSIIDGLIIETNGFRIFKDNSKKKLIKKLANERGLVIVTDSDSAGFVIRNHLKSFISNDRIINVYIPRVEGKEKRKSAASAEGILGVEGIDRGSIIEAFRLAGVTSQQNKLREYEYASCDLFNLRLTGEGSKIRKEKFLKHLNLPPYINNKALLKYMNTADEVIIRKAVECLDEV